MARVGNRPAAALTGICRGNVDHAAMDDLRGEWLELSQESLEQFGATAGVTAVFERLLDEPSVLAEDLRPLPAESHGTLDGRDHRFVIGHMDHVVRWQRGQHVDVVKVGRHDHRSGVNRFVVAVGPGSHTPRGQQNLAVAEGMKVPREANPPREKQVVEVAELLLDFGAEGRVRESPQKFHWGACRRISSSHSTRW